MSAVHSRVIRAAAALHARGLGDVTAFNKSYWAKSAKAKEFWFSVGRYMFWPYKQQGFTREDQARWETIKSRAAAMRARAQS